MSLDEAGPVLVALATSEVTALLVALAAGGPDMPFSESGATATARLLDGLGTQTRMDVEQLRERVRTPAGQTRVHKRIRHTVQEAVRTWTMSTAKASNPAEPSRPVVSTTVAAVGT